MSGPESSRPLGPLLLLGMLTVPLLFCWLLLRSGYGSSLRRTGFVYTAVMTGVGVIGRFS